MLVGTRRHFLKTAAGLLVAVPFMPSVARGQATQKKLRLVTARSQQGTYKDNFRPNVAGLTPTMVAGGAAKSYDLTGIAGPLSATFGPEFNALKSKINFYKGLDPMVTDGGHNHATFLSAYQTCNNGVSNEIPLSETPPGKEYLFPPKPSMDQLISNSAFERPYEVHNVAMTHYEYNVESLSYSYALSGGRIVRIRGFYDPVAHFNKFFAGATSGSASANAKVERRKLVVDQVLGSYRDFVNQRALSSADKLALDNHMEFLSSVQSRLSSSLFQTCSNPGITVDSRYSVSNGSLERAELIEPTYKLVIDIALAAMRCDAVRVFNFCMYNSGAQVAGGGPHGMHHMDTMEPNKRAYATGHDVWYGKMLAYLANQMDAVREPDGGTMLDNSLLLYGREMSREGPDHTTDDMLVATLGSLGGKVKTGQLIDYHRTITPNQPYGNTIQGRSYNQFLTSIMMNGFGLQPAQFETNGDYGERKETIWHNTPIVEKRVAVPGMFV